MLVRAITSIDDGRVGEFAGVEGSAFQIVAHHNDIAVVRHHHNRIFERLALGGRRHFGVGKSDDARSEAIGRGFKREARTGGGLKEEGRNDASIQDFTIGVIFKFTRHFHQIEDFFA